VSEYIIDSCLLVNHILYTSGPAFTTTIIIINNLIIISEAVENNFQIRAHPAASINQLEKTKKNGKAHRAPLTRPATAAHPPAVGAGSG